MFDIGLSELALTAVVALLVLGPKDMMIAVRYVAAFVKNARKIALDAKAELHEAIGDIPEIDMKTSTIIDLDGKPQIAYNVAELDALRQPAAKPATEAKPAEPAPHE